jgi:glycerol kinase
MSSFVGAIDQGTTSTRFIVFDQAGDIVASAQQEHPQIFPQPGWVEHDPMDIARNTEAVIVQALQSGGLTGKDIVAIGITNQRETTMVWDRRTGAPLHNALVWQDTRVDPLVAYFAGDGGKDRFRAATGLPLASYFSSLKLKWLLDHVPGARALANDGHLLFGTMDSWVLWNLTGGAKGGLHVTDVTNASRTQLMRLDTLQWDDELLRTFSIPRSVLPAIASSSEVYGEVASGPLEGVPIAGILGDTGAKPVSSAAGLVTTVAYRFAAEPACFALEGSIAISGALVQWLRDNLGLIRTSAEIEELAASVQDNGDVYIVPAFSGLYAPYWKDHARGVITGLTRYANRGHIARATLEATAYQTRDVVAAMEQDSGIRLQELRVDGGMVVNELLMQFQADILDTSVVRPKVTETTALGAAYAAGLATGYWRSVDDLRANWGVSHKWQPRMSKEVRGRLYDSWRKAVTRSFNWVE